MRDGSDERYNSFQFWREPIPEFDERDLPTKHKTEYNPRNMSFTKHEICDSELEENYKFDTSDHDVVSKIEILYV